MKKSTRIVIVAALLIAAAGVIALKNPASSGQHEAVTPSPTRLPRLVDLGASKCIPCKMMAPILDQLRQDYAGRLEVTFIDVWENPRASEEHGVRMIPTQIFFDAQGNELFRHEGFYSRQEILDKWRDLGFDFPTSALPGEGT